MEDLWCVAVGVFQVWVFVVVFLIMLPAMFGLSLGVTGVYIQILVKILQVTSVFFSLFSLLEFSLLVLVCPRENLPAVARSTPYLICLFSYEMCSRRHRVRGHLKITFFIVGHVTNPEGSAGAARRPCASAQR